MSPLAVRWLKFNFVGALGVVVQLAALALLTGAIGTPYLPATAAAVETAVLHNFVWHERFTWKDRTGGKGQARWRGILMRLLRFHMGNGLISLAGNLVFMRILVGALHLKVLVANVVSIAVCSLLNFAAGEWFVFRQ